MKYKLKFIDYLESENYFSWIANLGVVPLFLFSAFLLAPVFFCLFFLIILVCLVFEPIVISPAISNYFKNFKNIYVYRRRHLVKGIMLIGVFLSNAAIAQKQIFIAKGEQSEILKGKIIRFSIGNKEVIKHKYLKSLKTLRIKGRSIGFSDLVAWDQAGAEHIYHIFVTSKKKHLTQASLGSELKSMGLETSIKGPHLHVQGKLIGLDNYINFHKTKAAYKDKIQSTVTLSTNLKNEIIAKIYKKLIASGTYQVSCQALKDTIYCELPKEEANKDQIKYFSKNLYVKFINRPNSDLNINFQISLNLTQVEYLNAESYQIGLHKIQKIIDLQNPSFLETLFDGNKMNFSDDHFKVSTMAQPESVIRLKKPIHLRLGQENQFTQNISQIGQSYEWKFSGLEIKITLLKQQNEYILEYETKYTTPTENSLSGSESKSSAIVKLGRPTKLFRIGLKSTSKGISKTPFLSSIPLVGNLFKARKESEQFKEIFGHVILKRI